MHIPDWLINRRLAQLLPVMAAGPVLLLVLSACGSSSSHPQSNTTPKAVIAVGRSPLGAILVGSNGNSVYLFEKDTSSKSTCYGACATAWPPVMATGLPGVGTGTHASLLGASTRTDGVTQVTYAGHPLYYFSGDPGPGSTSGEGLQSFGGGWDLISPSGKKVEKGG